jgi:hypothetical protein
VVKPLSQHQRHTVSNIAMSDVVSRKIHVLIVGSMPVVTATPTSAVTINI